MTAHEGRRIRVNGRVQGVGFRAAACIEARRLGVTGWVRNRRDGSVEAVVHGTPDTVAAMLAWLRRGPADASVTHVAVEFVEPGNDRFSGFDALPTV